MTKLKRVFLTMLVIILLGVTVVFATDDETLIIGDGEPSTSTPETTNTNTNTNTNTSSYNNTQSLPQTGENDHIYVLAIGAFVISAVYAYKKVVDYKQI